MCTLLGEKHLTTTANHPQTISQAESYNTNILNRLQPNVVEHQKDQYFYVQLLTYSYNTQINRIENQSTSSLVPSRLHPHPPGPTLLCSNNVVPKNVYGKTTAATLLNTGRLYLNMTLKGGRPFQKGVAIL